MTHLQAEWQPIPEVFFSGNPLVPSRNGAALRRRNRAWSCDRTGGYWGTIFHTAIVGSQYVPIICVNITCIHHAFLLRSNLWNTWLKSAETWWRNLAGGHLVGAMRWQHGCTVVPWAWSSCFEAKPRNFASFQYVLMRKVPAGCFSLLTSYKDPKDPMWGIYGPYASKQAKRSRKKLHEVTWRLQCHHIPPSLPAKVGKTETSNLHQPAEFPQWHGRTVLTTAWDQKQTVVKGFAWRYDGRGTAYCHQGCGWKSICNL